ncbi:hypothetical protein [Natronobacterium gregoryi]|uniref:Uncharacterized protein n=2 Tax=Natronobacterium gregoryi TaxID=44930 RepID=L0AII5_NATGS|nr:hypothetical protein [Natronobacterium gregoryi]AFZ72885.1 hypothetical protein Natgr_1687 [Natronobacterium gregoryi SP2]ELY69623.1 hypothetical protein C490_07461 [Natronobacterium gregoryi SP2]PLK21886.1 hypothetical protein CYV19_01965 [Natronobacterium gregoryi SP2]SFI66432.1 hypothetical protein SAMN05443661_10353 [Natronobacterium gregoryi]
MSLSRRQLLAGTGTAFVGVTAGCSANEDGDGANDDEDGAGGGDANETSNGGDETADPETGSDIDAGPDETVLGEITVENVHDEPHTVDVIVEFDGEIEHWTTHELAAGNGLTLEREWRTGEDSFRVMARLDEEPPIQVDAGTWNDPDCLNLLALIDRNGDLSLLGDTDGGPCGGGDADFD